jgi:predicted alpha/beta hydrolase family esterase
MQFSSNIFIIPGLGNSGEGHWQTLWQQQFGFARIEQKDWETPVLEDWIATIDEVIGKQDLSHVILVGHSLACTTIAAWASTYKRTIKAALLVALSDTEAPTYPTGTTGFNPMCLEAIPFKTIAVASNNDYYVTIDRAKYFAGCWQSEFINIGDAGHINVSAGFGEWPQGLQLLQQLDTL